MSLAPPPMTVPRFVAAKAQRRKLAVITAYDWLWAGICDAAGVDAILVGDTLAPELTCPPSVTVFDRRGSPSGEIVFFSVTATDDSDPSPTVVCVPPSGSFFPQGTTIVTCTATDASGNESMCMFPVVVQPPFRNERL